MQGQAVPLGYQRQEFEKGYRDGYEIGKSGTPSPIGPPNDARPSFLAGVQAGYRDGSSGRAFFPETAWREYNKDNP